MKKTLLVICLMFAASFAYADGLSIKGIINKYKTAKNVEYQILSLDERDYADMVKCMGLNPGDCSKEELMVAVKMGLDATASGLMEMRLVELENCSSDVQKAFVADAKNIKLGSNFELGLDESGVKIYASESDKYCELLLINTNIGESGIVYFKGTESALTGLMETILGSL